MLNNATYGIRRGYLFPNEIFAFLLSEKRPDYKLLWLLQSDCGLRISEAIGQTWNDLLDFTRSPARPARQLRIFGKGRKVRHVPTSNRLRSHVADLYGRGSYPVLKGMCFTQRRRDPINPFPFHIRSAEYHFHTVLARAGIKRDYLVPHSLRHSYAMRLLGAGIDIYTVSCCLGHSSIAVTQEYLHLLPSYNRDVMLALTRSEFNQPDPNDFLIESNLRLQHYALDGVALVPLNPDDRPAGEPVMN